MSSTTETFSSIGGSFRDPAGFVFTHRGKLYRQVNVYGKADYDHFISSGLYDQLVSSDLIIAHREVQVPKLPVDKKRYKVLRPHTIPFISYPYEWGFAELKAAASLTLKVQKAALAHGMILKDASAYNIQFIGRRPIFIDTLSFRVYQAGTPWDGYRQFCEHFIAPLAVAAYGQMGIFKNLRAYLDGLPLAEAVMMLPSRARFKRGLATHLYLHAASQKRYGGTKKKDTKPRKVSKLAMEGLLASLEATVRRLRAPKQVTEWGDYYNDTNYSAKAFTRKQSIVDQLLKAIKPSPKMVWDLGANDGTFSEIAASAGSYVVAFDIDAKAVELNFSKSRHSQLAASILPLRQDLANPSPALGWAHKERDSLEDRGPADAALALALVHHLAIGNNLPFSSIAEYFSKLCHHLIVEFVPKSDSKVQILLARRANQFPDYSLEKFEAAFGTYFQVIKKLPVADSSRVIYLLKRRSTYVYGKENSKNQKDTKTS